MYLHRMKLTIDKGGFINTDEPLDISLPLSNDDRNPRAWYVTEPVFEPVRTDHYVGSVKEGGSVNFRNIFFNPHGHGTHTECLGHITKEVHSINNTLSTFWFKALLMTVEPSIVENNGVTDRVIYPEVFNELPVGFDALIIRTLPNNDEKKHMNYSQSNPCYFDVDCADVMMKKGIKHLLVDLPSVDRESDGGELAFHHRFWEVPESPNFERTITELIFVNDTIVDGTYILNLQVAPFENDASPCRPVLYEIKNELT